MANEQELIKAAELIIEKKSREPHLLPSDVAALKLARHYLADRKGDEAITEEWCRELLGKRNVGRMYEGGTWIPEIRGIDQYVRLSKTTTRRQLLSLLSALGIEVTQ